MKIGKTLLGIGLAVVIAAVAVIFLVVRNIDALVVAAVETVGSRVTQTQVTLDEASIQLKEGRGALTGLRVANPEGFTSANAFELNDIALGFDISSISGPVYVINEVTINGAQLVVEQTAEGNNLKQLADAIRANTPAKKDQAPSTTEPGTEAEQPAKQEPLLAIKQVTFTNNQATLITEKYGQQTLPLPSITLTDLGDAENGLTPNQLAAEIMLQLFKQAEQRVADQVTEQAKEELEKAAKRKLEKATDALKKAFGGSGE